MFGNTYPSSAGFTREDFGPSLITAGLSMLANNNGSMNTAQLIGQGGLDALAGLQARKKYEAAMARQQEQDAMNQQKHDLAMRQGNAELAEAARRAQLEQAAASGNEDAIKALAPLEWWKMQQQKAAASLAHQRALELAAVNAYSKNQGTYDKTRGGYVRPDGTFVPVQFPPNSKEAKQQELAIQKGNVVLDDVQTAKKLAKDYQTIPNTGIGSLFRIFPGTTAHDLDKTLDSIRANVSFDQLNAMRQASPTGGALGNVSNQENTKLEAALGSLEQSQSEEQFLRNLERVESIYADIVHGAGNWRRTKDGQIEVGFGIGNAPSMTVDMGSAADALIAKHRTKKKGNR